jgi:DNA-binding XRE family transcriptional regulator
VTKAERRECREAVGTQQGVAELLGIGRRTLIRYEHAKKPPRWYELALLGLRAEKKPEE